MLFNLYIFMIVEVHRHKPRYYGMYRQGFIPQQVYKYDDHALRIGELSAFPCCKTKKSTTPSETTKCKV